MAGGENLGEFEQIVMLALLRLGNEAYGLSVRREIKERTGRDASSGSVYATLTRLEGKGLVSSRMGDPTAERGGRAKKHFEVTIAGQKALKRSIEAVRNMAEGLLPQWM